MGKSGHVVLVDAYAPSRGLAPEFRNAGFECVRVQSTSNVPKVYQGALNLDDYVCNLVHRGNIEETTRAVSAFDPVAVIPGGELGVELADALSAALGAPSNGTALSSARRNKYAMIERIATCGLRAAKQLLIENEEHLEAWHDSIGGQIVVKPVMSAAGDGVAFCQTPEESVKSYRSLLGRENVFSQLNYGVVAQEYVVGTEYIVNTVSRGGRHHVCDIWRTGRISLNGITDLLVESNLVEAESEVPQRLMPYARDVLDALGLRYGPAHLEIKLTPQGPCLVEAAARISGGDLPYFTRDAVGESQIDWIVDSYVRPDRFDARCGEPYRIARHFGWAALASPYDGILKSYRGLDTIRVLESFHELRILVKPGERIRPTVDDLSYPVTVTLLHDAESIVLRDLRTIRYLDGSACYELDSESATGLARK
jgi:biotin carboxylase